jgi:hypothetical protein
MTSVVLSDITDRINRVWELYPEETTFSKPSSEPYLDENITDDSLEEFPLAKYATAHWICHAQFENISSNAQDETREDEKTV